KTDNFKLPFSYILPPPLTYGETPYRFNVINPLLIAQIYELFLGEELVIDDSGEIKLEKKRNNPLGSVSTPYQVAKSIVEDEIERFDSVDDIKILDPNAGSGTFLISAFDILVQKKEEVLSRKLTFNEMKEIITKQLFAVDIDFGAIQVLRMGISLKLMLGNYVKPVIFKKALSEYKENFILGNTIINREKLSDSDWEHEEIIDSLPLSYQEAFPAIMEDGGFDLIISNPPYVEPKLYTKKWPYSYGLLKDMYGFPKEKIDSSLFFLKRYFELLKNGGKLGIIIQRRFFATKYGQSIRKWLSKEGYLEEILSIQDNSLFKGRTTYVAVLYGQKKYNKQVTFKNNLSKITTDLDKRKLTKEFQQKIVVDAPIISNGIWSVKAMYAEEVICSLFKNTDRKFYKINDKDAELKIIVGPQVLDKKFYYLTGDIDANGMFKGSNNENEDVVIEKELVRPIQGNSKLYSFSKKFSPEYILFPYDNEIVPLNLDYIENNYPKGFQYLSKVKKESKTRRNPGEKWYTYTRKQNLQYLTTPKVASRILCK
ncbi:Eco57I restriction-modification methylase domain-containing protein, partial [Secundilactobacillus similis]